MTKKGSVAALVALAVAGCGSAAWAARGRKAERVEVPFETVKGRKLMLVRAKVAGKDAVMFFDTGAEGTLLDRRFLGLKRSGSRQLGGTTAFEGKEVRDLCIEDHCFSKKTVGLVELDDLSGLAGRDVNGIIGQDVLRDFDSVTIDYRRGVVVLTVEEDR